MDPVAAIQLKKAISTSLLSISQQHFTLQFDPFDALEVRRVSDRICILLRRARELGQLSL